MVAFAGLEEKRAPAVVEHFAAAIKKSIIAAHK
jgi:hypothetical protein